MTAIITAPVGPPALPDHTQLPEKDGSFVKNFQEHPQGSLLTDSLWPVLDQIHPDGQFCIGHDCGIYWRITDPPLDGCKAPDWFYVPHVPPMLNGELRRSYVLWQEIMAPLVILEFVSGDGTEERDPTPWKGKLWVYERAIRPAFYGIYERELSRVTVYHLVEGRFDLLPANERGHYPIAQLGVELGIWQGSYKGCELPWLRWWNAQGQLLPTLEERLEQERRDKEQAQQRAERLAERLRALGVNPED